MTTHRFNDHDKVVKIQLTHKDAKIPQYAKHGDAGADVYAVSNSKSPSQEEAMAAARGLDEKGNLVGSLEPGDYILPPGRTVVLDLGLKIQLRHGWEMQVRSRSGVAKRGLVVANQPGTIDSGYRGPCMVMLHNNTKNYRVIKPGTRVAQFVLKRAPQAVFEQVEVLDDSDRGEGGFGSTGTK